MTAKNRALGRLAVAAMVWLAAGVDAVACEQYKISSSNQIEPVRSAIQSLEAGSVFPQDTDFLFLQERTLKQYPVGPVLQQEWVSQRVEYEFCRSKQAAGAASGDVENQLIELRVGLYLPQRLQRIYATTMGENRVKVASLQMSPDIIKKLLKISQTRFLLSPPYVVNSANKYFVIVASVQDERAAVAHAIRLKQQNPDLDFDVYAPYYSNPYHGIMLASWVDRATALEARDIARERIAADAYIWTCKSDGRFC